ncbi:predicted protein [Plenodomus lingam JN3]|uniref:Predicted protein n=1 Tax=Leptosphaeria maculans (strain JN3 / isolate v23.1.3 / race Av1-4-5-6-7-8) TaxID=985895 RepID=E4ZRK7_LEPMJ|nr:predicted protein [Plenodomus lingam JN3]CBX93854.1 predicted protein [Plenodomus lingam JN3]
MLDRSGRGWCTTKLQVGCPQARSPEPHTISEQE